MYHGRAKTLGGTSSRSIRQAMYGVDVCTTIHPAIIVHEESILRSRSDYDNRQSDIMAAAEDLASEWAEFPPEIIFATAKKLLSIFRKRKITKFIDENRFSLIKL